MTDSGSGDSASQLFLKVKILFWDWEARGVTRSKMLPSTGQTEEHT